MTPTEKKRGGEETDDELTAKTPRRRTKEKEFLQVIIHSTRMFDDNLKQLCDLKQENMGTVSNNMKDDSQGYETCPQIDTEV